MNLERPLPLRIVGLGLPGREQSGPHPRRNVHVGVQRGDDVVGRVPGDAGEAVWDLVLHLAPGRDGDLEVRGPWVHGRSGDRFLYLSWGEVGDDGEWGMFRRLKLWPGEAGAAALERAAQPGHRLELRLGLSDADGGPLCGGRTLAAAMNWQVVPV
jgi:Family of unknown function (DUF5990)